MRRYDDAVEVRRGRLPGEQSGGLAGELAGIDLEGPEQFLWRGRLWKVRAIVAYWVETGAWWSRPASDDGRVALGDLLAERELWRVEAGRGRPGLLGEEGEVTGVFDLCLDWSDGRWQLVGCVD